MTSSIFRLVSRVRGLFGRKEADSEFDREMQMHLQLLTEQFIRQGMNPKDAWSAARRQFGNTTLLRQRHRESRTLLFIPKSLPGSSLRTPHVMEESGIHGDCGADA